MLMGWLLLALVGHGVTLWAMWGRADALIARHGGSR